MAAILALGALAACGEEQPASEGDTGTVSLKTVVPTGVACVRFVLSNSNASTKDFNVAVGASSVSLDLGPLVTGWVLVDPYAFNVACSLVTTATRADWVGDQVGFAVFPGRRTEFSVMLRPNSSTTGTVDFVVPVKAIAAGAYTTYALLQDGTVRAWGSDSRGQLGKGTQPGSPTPVAVTGLVAVREIAAGPSARSACAIRGDSTLACWGENTYGQLGDGTTIDRTVPTPVAVLYPYVQVSMSGSHSCARQSTGSLYCWGDNSRGQFGNGTTVSQSTPVYIRGGTEQVAVADFWSVSRGGKGFGASGSNQYGQLGDGTLVDRTTPVFMTDGTSWPLQISAGSGFRCAIMASDRSVRCVGKNYSGELGDGTTVSKSLPVTVSGLQNVTAIALGGHHACAIKSDGTVWCWGHNQDGALGDGTWANRSIPAKVPGLAGATSLALGSLHSCALLGDGSVWCWGDNESAQLGDGTTFDRPLPVKVAF